MKKIYYFSEEKLEFVELKQGKAKFLEHKSLILIGIASLILFILSFFNLTSSVDSKLVKFKNENKALKNKLEVLVNKYDEVNVQVDSLLSLSDYLRLAANLQPLAPDVKALGTGGAELDNYKNFVAKGSSNLLNKIDNYVNRLDNALKFEKKEYVKLSSLLQKQNDLYAYIPAIKPSSGEYMTSGFGIRLHPILKVRKMHNGVDIILPVGTDVKSSAKGTIAFAGNKGGFGNVVEIDHKYGYKTIYAHLSEILVKEGQQIKRNDIIARSGNTGLSSGPHLHYEVHHNGSILNPVDFFFDDYLID